MTNREWLSSLTNEQLAQFLTFGLRYKIPVCFGNDTGYQYDYINIRKISQSFVNSIVGVEKWLEEEYDGRYDQ